MSTELVSTKLRQRAAFMREAGHNDDADLDEEAAAAIDSLGLALARKDQAFCAMLSTGVCDLPARLETAADELAALTAKVALLTEALSDTRTFLTREFGTVDTEINGVVGWIDEAIGPVPVVRSEPDKDAT